MDITQRITHLIPWVAEAMMHNKWSVVLAESCSGGSLASILTSLPGSSKWFKFSLVTYSNEAKQQFLKISKDLLQTQGAVSSSCALAMLKGLRHEEDFRLTITGFAGPGGEKLGEVYIAWQAPDDSAFVQVFHFQGSRQDIIAQVIYQSLRQMLISSHYPFELNLNYFFAISLEDAHVSNQCLQYGLNLGLSPTVMEPFNNLHVTLVYLGPQTSFQAHILKQKVDTIKKINAFNLDFKACEQWTRAQCLVLKAIEIPKNLKQLLKHLPKTITSDELVPHITIAKRQVINNFEPVPVDIRLKVTNFSLMLSFHGIFYLEYGRWSLNMGEKND
jgi:nicotinamide-nucleotide amidase